MVLHSPVRHFEATVFSLSYFMCYTIIVIVIIIIVIMYESDTSRKVAIVMHCNLRPPDLALVVPSFNY